MYSSNIISLTTDFGLIDPFVGIVKGVILSKVPTARLIDITHNIEPQNILQCYYALKASYTYFPKGTVHLAVVDPGVGSKRRSIAVRFQDYFFVGPDNGIFSFTFQGENNVHEITDASLVPESPSNTFHGRDIFAPAAASFATGMPIESAGPKINNPVQLSIPTPILSKTQIKGEVIYVDHFGNVSTNIEKKAIQDLAEANPNNEIFFKCKGRDGNMVSSYSQGEVNSPCAIINSWSLLELFITSGNLRNLLNIQVGNDVLIYMK